MMTIRLSSAPVTEIRHERGYTVTEGSPMETVLPMERHTVRNETEAQRCADAYVAALIATGRAAQFLVSREKRPGERAFKGFDLWQQKVRTITNAESVTVRAEAA